MSFAKGSEIKDLRALFTGVENFKVVAVNPTKEELEDMFGTEITYDPEYISEQTVNDADGERTVKQVKLDFFLNNNDPENSIATKISFYIANTHHKSQTGKIKVINDYGKTTWLEPENVKSRTVPQNMQWYSTDGMTVALRGEEELVEFLTNLLNIPFDHTKVKKKEDAMAKIGKDIWKQVFSGDFSFFKETIASTNNKIGVALGVKTTEDGSLRQFVYNKKTLRQYTKASKRADKFKYLQKAITDSQTNGVNTNVDFGDFDFELKEYNLTQSKPKIENDTTDIFDMPTQESKTEEDDWMDIM